MVCEGRNYCMPKAYMLFDVTRLLCSKRRTVAPSHKADSDMRWDNLRKMRL